MMGAFHDAANWASLPPPVIATMAAPASAASAAAWSVSSVFPDADTANTRLRVPTNAGHS